MIRYVHDADSVSAEGLPGFFDGWPDPPSPETHLRLLHNSDHVVLAVDEANGRVVGFITAITDGVLFAYIPLLEVLPAYRGKGIGSELMRRMLDKIGDLYSVDLVCDPDLQPFYERNGMTKVAGMTRKRYDRQSG